MINKKPILLLCIMLLATIALSYGILPTAADDVNWIQINAGGFGTKNNASVSAMQEFQSGLYVGTHNTEWGCELWRHDGNKWTYITTGGFGEKENRKVSAMAEYSGELYIGTWNEASGCRVYKTDGKGYTEISTPGFGKKQNTKAASLTVFEGHLYAGTSNQESGGELWRYDGHGWKQMTSGGFGNANNISVSSLAVFEAKLFMGTENDISGCEIWSFDGESLVKIRNEGFGSKENNRDAPTAAVYGEMLYFGTENLSAGAQLWSYDGEVWNQAADFTSSSKHFNNMIAPNNKKIGSLLAMGDLLYVGTYTTPSGGRVYAYNGIVWEQLNSGGFGDPKNTEITALAIYNLGLCAGTRNDADGCEIHMSRSGKAWTRVSHNALGDTDNVEIGAMRQFGSNLYAGTSNTVSGCEVWAFDGVRWAQVNVDGFGNVNNASVSSMEVYKGLLYAGTGNEAGGFELWRYDGAAWNPIGGSGFNDEANKMITSMTVYDGKLFMGSFNEATGTEIWSFDGTTLQPVSEDGLGDPENVETASLEVHEGRLFAGTRNLSTGGQVWEYEGSEWIKVAEDGFGRKENESIEGLKSSGGKLYAGTRNSKEGCELWAFSKNEWICISDKGFGDSDNLGIGSIAGLGHGIVVGTVNEKKGCEVLRYDGGAWQIVGTGGVASKDNIAASSLTHYKSRLYMGTKNPEKGANVLRNYEGIKWYLAEGCTMDGFETWILVQNPENSPAGINLEFQTDSGLESGPSEIIEANSRKTFYVGNYVKSYDVSTMVSSTSDVICERAVYWGGMQGGHNSIGTTEPATEWFIAEGCTEGGFETWILIQNPGPGDVVADVFFQTEKGEIEGPQNMKIPGRSRKTINAGHYSETFNISTKVEASGNVVCERAVYWMNRKGGHESIGVSETSKAWYLAEGCTKGGFETFILIQNPGDEEVNAELTIMTENGPLPVPINIQIPARSRDTVKLNDYVESFDVSTRVSAETGVIAERAVYFNGRRGGHSSIGAVEPQMKWFMAEGCTAGGFETWILIQNPSNQPVNVNVDFQTALGAVKGPQGLEIPANARKSVNAGSTISTFDLSTTVTSLDGPIICERAVYWNNRIEGHGSIGYSR